MKNIAIVFVVIAVLAVAFTASVFPQKKESAPLGRRFIQEKMMEAERGLRPHISGSYDKELFRDEQLKQKHRLKIGEKEIPLQTPDGTKPTEQQIRTIKNTFTEEFLVNDDDVITAHQFEPSIAMDGSGNFVIVWEDYRDGHNDIYLQRYNSSGVAQGVNTKVNNNSNTYQSEPAVAMDCNGNFVIVWVISYYENSDIYFQRYNSSGIAQGTNTKVNDVDRTVRHWVSPSIAMDGNGNFVIVWQDYRNGWPDIYSQRYNSNGTVQGVNTKVNDYIGTSWEGSASIAMNGSGNYVIAWQDGRPYGWDIYFQRYNSSGVAQGVNIKVNDDIGEAEQNVPSIAMDGNGNFVIVWGDSRNGNADIYYQKYNADGEVQGENIKVNDDIGKTRQYAPSIALDRNGNMVIVWQDERNGYYDIYYQRYDSEGVPRGENRKVNDDVGTKEQVHPSIAMDGCGNYVIVWEDYRNSNSDIYYQKYNSNGSAQGVNIKVNDDIGTASQIHPSIVMDESGFGVIVWEDYRYGSNNPDVIAQWYFPIEPFGIKYYRIVPDGPNHGERSPVVVTSKSQIVFSWEDNRRSKGWDIYAMIVRGDTVVSEMNIPTEFALQQNYPNPFNPKTKIYFSVPKESYITLKVYDLLGREVATLAQEKKQQGEYFVTWSAEGVPSGVYFYRLVAVDPSLRSGQVFIETKRMVVMK